MGCHKSNAPMTNTVLETGSYQKSTYSTYTYRTTFETISTAVVVSEGDKYKFRVISLTVHKDSKILSNLTFLPQLILGKLFTK